MRIQSLRRCLPIAILLLLVPSALAQEGQMTEQQQRDELVKVLELRAQAYQRRIDMLKEQAEAVRTGADMDTIRRALRANPDAIEDAPPRDAENEGHRERRRNGFARRDPHTDGPPPELTEALITRVMADLERDRPQLHERLVQLRKDNPERFRAVLVRIMPKPITEDPEGAALELQVRSTESRLRELAKQAKENPEERESLRSQVRDALNAAADARIDFERYRIAKERERIDRQESFLERMISYREKFIDERLEAILSGIDFRSRRPRPESDEPGEAAEGERGSRRGANREGRPRPSRNENG